MDLDLFASQGEEELRSSLGIKKPYICTYIDATQKDDWHGHWDAHAMINNINRVLMYII